MMLALPARVPPRPIQSIFVCVPLPELIPSGPVIYIPGWPKAIEPVQAAPEVGLKPQSDAFFQHDHTAWGLIPCDQAEKLRRDGEILLDQALAFMTGQIDTNTFTNASNDFFKKVQRLRRTGDDKPRPKKQVNPFQYIDPTQPMPGQQKLIEGKRLAVVLHNLLGLEVTPTCGTFRSGDYKYHLHPNAELGDGLDIERLRPDHTAWLGCMTPAYDKLGVEAAMEDLRRQYEDIVARIGRPRFVYQSTPGQVIVERGSAKVSPPQSTPDKDQLDQEIQQAFFRGAEREATRLATMRADQQQASSTPPPARPAGLYLRGGDHVQ